MLTLWEIIQRQLIPWSQEDAGDHFITVRKKMRQADMPYGARLSSHQIRSKRVPIKNRRVYNSVRNIIAEWPEAGLQELGKHKLVCVIAGNVDYPLGGYKVKCGAGYFIFIPPGTPCPDGSICYLDRSKSTFYETVTFLLHPNALECWASHADAEKRVQRENCLVLNNQVISFFHSLIEEVFNEAKTTEISRKILNVIFEILLREIKANRFQPVRSTVQEEQEVMKRSPTGFLAHLEQYVQANLHKQLTLDAAAASMYFSPTHFNRLMRRETGQSFNKYISGLRLTEAQKLLAGSQWSISAIARMVGFQSTSYFCTFFKSNTGITPGEFRAKHP